MIEKEREREGRIVGKTWNRLATIGAQVDPSVGVATLASDRMFPNCHGNSLKYSY